MLRRPRKDVKGKRFGRLIVLRRTGRSNRAHGRLWLCLCDCGKKKSVAIGHLGRSVNSCGCLRREMGVSHIKHTHTGATKDWPRFVMWNTAKQHAKQKGLPFNISLSDIVFPKICPLLGIPLVRGIGKPGPNSPSLDRIIPKLGYVKGNIQVISNRANTIKNDASLDELETIVNNWKRMEYLSA